MFQRILIVVDRRASASAALEQGVELAAIHAAEVVLFTMLPELPIAMADSMAFAVVSSGDFSAAAADDARSVLRAASRVAENAGVHAIALVGCGDDAADCIVQAARTHDCDLIVVASRGANAVLRLLNGSPIPGLISESSIPVLVCKAVPSERIGVEDMVKALVAHDPSR